MDELTLDDELYVSTKRAAKITGYAKDYIGQLCREGRVKARLVGRNWYVLDESIREHRFGEVEPKEKEQKAEKSAVSEWNSPVYAPEPVSEMAIVGKRYDEIGPDASADEQENAEILPGEDSVEPEPIRDFVSASQIDTSAVVKEMQSAWQDWFKQSDSQKIVDETVEDRLLDTPEVMDARENDSEGAEYVEVESARGSEDVEESVESPKAVESGWEAGTEEEVSVTINRTYTRTEEVQKSHEAIPVATSSVADWQSRTTRTVQSRRGRPLRRKAANGGRGILNSFIRVVLIFVILVSIVVCVLGTGSLNRFFTGTSVKYYPIQYLGGESVSNKQ